MTIRDDAERWQQPHVVDRVIVEPARDYDHNALLKILEKHKAKIRKDLIEELEQAQLIESAEPDGLLQAGSDEPDDTKAEGEYDEGEPYGFTPNDPYFSRQWHHPNIGTPDAWALTQGAATVKIAVIDSGAYQHPDLQPNVTPGFHFWEFNDNTTDSGALGGHGTATAGTIGAVIGNGVGVAGVVKCKVMPLLVLASNNYAAWSDVADAMMYATDHGCRIMNISIYGSSPSSTLESAAAYVWRRNGIVFACAGNAGNQTVQYPAGCNNVMACAATTQSNTKANFSSYGTWVDIAAPGVGVFTISKTAGYGGWSGTSFAAPICAGVAGLMIAANSAITNAKIASIMKQTASACG